MSSDTVVLRVPGAAPVGGAGARSGLRRVAGISGSLVGTQALTSVLGLVFWTVAARTFTVAEVGVAGAAVAMMTLLSSFGSFGLGTLLIARLPQTISADRRVLVRTCLVAAGAAAGLLAVVVPLVGIHLAGADSLRPIAGTLAALGVLAVGTALASVVLVLDQAVLTVGVGTLQLERNVAASVIKIVALVVLAALGVHGGMTVFLAWTLGTALSLVVVAWRTRGGPAGRRFVDPAMLRGLRGSALSHHALNTTLQGALQILPIIVTLVVSAQDTAYFNTALMVCGFVFALPYAIAIGIFAAARGDENEVLGRLPLTLAVSAGVSVTAYAVLYPLAGPALSIFGVSYADQGVELLRILALAGVPFVVKDHFVALRRVQGRTTSAVVVLAVGLVVELAAAVAGARLGGTVGLCAAWVGVLALEALVLAVPLVRARLAWSRSTAPTTTAEPATTLLPTVDLDLPTMLIPVVAPRAADPPTERVRVQRAPRTFDRNLLGPVVFLMSLGLALMALGAAGSRGGDPGPWQVALWIAGQVLVVGPPAVRVLAPRTGDGERVVLAVLAGMMLQLSRVLLNPIQFVFHDEQLHLTTWRQLHESGHLFSVNSLLPVSAYYPGLELATDALVHLTGLSVFVAGNLVLFAARAVMMLALIGLVRVVSGSYRAAAVAAMVYLCNPQFLFFNSQYSYQTLALPMALFVVYAFVSRRRGKRSAVLAPALGMVAVTMTHHLTAMLLVAAFGVWLVIEAITGRRKGPGRREHSSGWHRRELRDLLLVVVVGTVTNALLMLSPGSPVIGYLVDIFTSSGNGVTGLAAGGRVKPVFSDSAGAGPAPFEQVLLLASVLITMVALLAALVELRSSVRHRQAACALLALLALLYPIIPAGHLTVATAEVGDRASGYVFVGIGVAVGAWVARRRLRGPAVAVLAVLLTVTFLGSVVLGAGPTGRQLPGSYLISADARSMDGDNLAAARWLADTLPPGQRVFADRVAGLLASSEGDQFTVRHLSTGIDASPLLLDPAFTARDVELIRSARIAYLVVDTRISEGLPHLDVYVESGEYMGLTRTAPVPAAALFKFATVPGAKRIYDNGSLQIYDLRTLRDGR